jgi:thiazolinyl imide reductase
MRVLVCGTLYGSAYLQALQAGDCGLRLAGILARGSSRSRELAARLGVPFYSRLEELPAGGAHVADVAHVAGVAHAADIADLAIVAVGGPAGTALGDGLLRRGMHVLIEHPRETPELERSLEEAARRRLVYHVNSHFGDLEAPQAFLAAFAAWSAHSRLRLLSLASNPRALYSCVELAARALGSRRPFSFAPAETEPAAGGPLVSIHGEAGGVPLVVQCLRIDSASDDGADAWVSHRVAATFEAGTLLLAEASGPALWLPAAGAPAAFATPQGQARLAAPAWSVLSGFPPTHGQYVWQQRDAANRLALRRLVHHVASGVPPPEQVPRHLLAVSAAWRQLMDRIGPLRPHPA